MSWGAAIGGIVSGISNWWSGKKNRSKQSSGQRRAIGAQKSEAALDRELQREFAQHGIRWRVEDAKAAGLHPLSALGVSPAMASPSGGISVGGTPGADSSIPGLDRVGQNLERAARGQMTAEQRQTHSARISMMEAQAQKDQAIGAYYASEAARARQSDAASAPMPGDTSSGVRVYGVGDYYDRVRAVPDEVVSTRSRDPSIAAGTHAYWREYEYSPGNRVVLPFSEEGPIEAIQSTPLALLPGIYQRNADVYGPEKARKVMLEVFGWRPPREAQGPADRDTARPRRRYPQ